MQEDFYESSIRDYKIIYHILCWYSDRQVNNMYYVYMLCYPNKTPFYIGKARGYYARELHHFPGGCGAGGYVLRVIMEIWKKREPVLIIIPYVCKTERQALKMEALLINFYGILHKKDGPLVNRIYPRKYLNESQLKAWQDLRKTKKSCFEKQRELFLTLNS